MDKSDAVRAVFTLWYYPSLEGEIVSLLARKKYDEAKGGVVCLLLELHRQGLINNRCLDEQLESLGLEYTEAVRCNSLYKKQFATWLER
jgi:hypothetical protein